VQGDGGAKTEQMGWGIRQHEGGAKARGRVVKFGDGGVEEGSARGEGKGLWAE